MITAPDAEHMRLRRLAGPAFLNAGIAEVEPILQHSVDHLCSQLKKASAEGSQNMVEWFLWTLNDVIGQLALDQDFQCLENRRLHPWATFLMGQLKRGALMNQFRRFGISSRVFNRFMTAEMKEAAKSFLITAVTAVNQRLAREKDDTLEQSQKPTRDIVGLMLREMKGGDRLTEPEITSNAILVVGGGAETTSTCLSATMLHLCKTPRVMQKLCDELRQTFATKEEITLKAIGNLPYLKAVIDESLRIFPVASFITPRMTPKDGHVIDGQMIPGGV